MVNAEKLKLYFLLLFSNPLRFFSMAGLKLFKDPLYFFRFALKYLKNKEQSNSLSQKIKDTQAVYGFLWAKLNNGKPQRWHYNNMQETISEPIVRGKRGIDIGSGCGYDTLIMAKSNPAVKIISLEISEGAFKTRKLTCGLGNVWVVRGSALNIPISDNTLDFAYSFGVLHHTTDPERGIKEIARVIKKDSPVYLYVYEDHSENRIKYLALKLVKVLRVITTNIPPRVLYIISFLASPFIMVFLRFRIGFLGGLKLLKRCPKICLSISALTCFLSRGIFTTASARLSSIVSADKKFLTCLSVTALLKFP